MKILEQPAPVVTRLSDGAANIWFIVVLTIWILANVFTAARSPTVWMDEVMYTDPAANLASGRGFTSTAWPKQTYGEFWAGNVPLHGLLLGVWLKVMPVEPAGVRSFNFFLLVLGVILLWLTAKKRLAFTTSARFWLVALLLTGYGITFSIRSGRPDGITMFLAGLAWWFASQTKEWFSLVGIFLTSALMPIAGLQLIPALFLTCAVFLMVFGWSVLNKVVAAGIGCLTGGLALIFFYRQRGLLSAFLESIRDHTAQGQHNGGLPAYLLSKLTSLPACYADPSYLLVAIAFFSLFVWRLFGCKNYELWRAQLTALILSVALPATLHFLGKYPIYYSWMAYGIMCWGVAIEIGLAIRFPSHGWLTKGCFGCLGAAVLAGFPARLLLTAAEWNSRDYSRVETMAAIGIEHGDWVYADFQAYYAVRNIAGRVFLPSYANGREPFPEPEVDKISKLFINPNNLSNVVSRLGGTWLEGGQTLDSGSENNVPFLRQHSASKYRLAIYRRVP